MRRLLARHGLPAAEFHLVIEGYEVDFRILTARWSSSATAGRPTAGSARSSSTTGPATRSSPRSDSWSCASRTGRSSSARRRRPNGSAATSEPAEARISCSLRGSWAGSVDSCCQGCPPRWSNWHAARPDRGRPLGSGVGGRGGRRRRRRGCRRPARRRRRRRPPSRGRTPGRRCRRPGPRRSRGPPRRATSCTGTPLATGRCTPRPCRTRRPAAPRASASARGSVPTTRMRRPSGLKSSKNTSAHVSAPTGLCTPSTTTSGWRPSTSKRPGITTFEEALDHDLLGGSGAAKNASAAVSAGNTLSPWWAPCNGTNTSG